jgi:cobalt/nickel transport system permease protein
MAIVAVVVSYMVYRTVRWLAGERPWSIYASGFIAAWTSVVVAALGTAMELAFSGTSPANIAIPTMGSIHALIGIGEGLITVGALAFLYGSRRDLLRTEQAGLKRGRLVWVAGLALALLLAVASPLASKHPDGLMRVAEQYGFINSAHSPIIQLVPHYLFPGISNITLATILAAVMGTLIVFCVAFGVAFARRRKPVSNSEQNKITPS